MEKAVVVIIYNRADKVTQLMSALRKVEPKKIYLIADGPKRESAHDSSLTSEAQRAFWNELSWDCEVFTNISKHNMGCGNRISSGLDWVFSQVEEAIIVEDDCIPSEDFFKFCDEMLDTFQNNSEIGTISGSNFLPSGFVSNSDFFVSNFTHVWGWATWRRTWENYSFEIKAWPKERKKIFDKLPTLNNRSRRYWSLAFDAVRLGAVDTWDYQLILMMWRHGLKSIVPASSLVQNIGFDRQATNTLIKSRKSLVEISRLNWPLRSPDDLEVLSRADECTVRAQYEVGGLEYILRRVYISLPSPARSFVKRIIRLVFH